MHWSRLKGRIESRRSIEVRLIHRLFLPRWILARHVKTLRRQGTSILRLCVLRLRVCWFIAIFVNVNSTQIIIIDLLMVLTSNIVSETAGGRARTGIGRHRVIWLVRGV